MSAGRPPRGRIQQGLRWLFKRPLTWWSHWWDARLPRRDQVTFTQRNLYIVPTPAGLGFAAVLLVMLLASINEQINLGYGLTFILSGASLVTMHLTHSNVRGLSLRLLQLRSVHAGDVLRLGVVLSHTGKRRGRFGLRMRVARLADVGLTGAENNPLECEVMPNSETTIELDIPAIHRGLLHLPRLALESRYPLGLFRAWGYWRPQAQVLVWPSLDPLAPPLQHSAGERPDAVNNRAHATSSEVPEGLRDYRRGDPMRMIAWKKSSHALASGSGLVSREAATGRSPDLWLDWELSPGLHALGEEARLSRLATWVIEADRQSQSAGSAYGLKLPGTIVECNTGSAHLRACLDALALWGTPPARTSGAKR